LPIRTLLSLSSEHPAGCQLAAVRVRLGTQASCLAAAWPRTMQARCLRSQLSGRLLALATVLAACAFIPSYNSAVAQTAEPPVFFPTTIEWNKQAGVSKYRLQIADDKDFHNILFDVQLAGGPHNVCWLSPGYYYWRVASSEPRAGAFLTPVRFFVSGGVSRRRRTKRSAAARTAS
jgi:hypothetical protein